MRDLIKRLVRLETPDGQPSLRGAGPAMLLWAGGDETTEEAMARDGRDFAGRTVFVVKFPGL